MSAHHAPRVLLVDDGEDYRAFVRTVLDGVAEVVETGSLAEAESVEGVEVVLCDLHLPDASGEEVVRAVRRAHPRAPLIVLSGSGEEVRRETLRAGATAFVRKGDEARLPALVVAAAPARPGPRPPPAQPVGGPVAAVLGLVVWGLAALAVAGVLGEAFALAVTTLLVAVLLTGLRHPLRDAPTAPDADQRAAIRALAEQREELTEAQHLARTGSFTWDPQTGESTASAELRAVLGLEPGRPVVDHLALSGTHPDDRAAVAAAVSRSLTDGHEVDLLHRVAQPDGQERLVQLRARSITDDHHRLRLVGSVQDVTELRRQERALRDAESTLRRVVELTSVGLAVADADERLVTANRALQELLGRDRDWFVGRKVDALLVAEDVGDDDHRRLELLEGRVFGYERRCRLRRADGSAVPVALTLTAVRDDGVGERPRQIVLQVVDVRERQAVEARLRDLATHDALTGLANRRRLDDLLGRAVALARRDGPVPGVLALDLDGFKAVNDRSGHAAGDDLLRRVAEGLVAVTRGTDLVVRVGGDEFVVLVAQADDEALRALGEKLLGAVHVAAAASGAPVTASVGAAVLAADEDAADLLRRADAALYDAKHAGGGRIQLAGTR